MDEPENRHGESDAHSLCFRSTRRDLSLCEWSRGVRNEG